MRSLALSIAVVALAACGGPAATITVPKPVPPPPLPAYEVVSSGNLSTFAADPTHVYWFDGGLHRRAHGGAQPAERLFVSDGWIDRLAIGRDDVFFSDDGYRLRALPKAGGAPSELAGIDEGIAGIAADGDGCWVLTGDRIERWSREPDERRLELPGSGVTFAVAGGEAFVAVRDGKGTLYRIELATGKAHQLSDEPYLADALALGVSGDSLVVALRDGVVVMPRRGGAAKLTTPSLPYAIAVDEAGYAISTDGGVIAHPRGAPPRLVASSTHGWTAGGSPTIALGGGYAYHVVYSNLTGEQILRGEPRGSGPEMLRVPEGGEVTDLAVDGDRVYIATGSGDGWSVVELTRQGAKTIGTAEGWIDGVVAGGGQVAWWAVGALFHAEAGAMTMRSDEVATAPVALHKGVVYWSDGADLRGIALAGNAPGFVVAPGSQDLAVTLQFADERLYFVQQLGESPALVRVDERRRTETIWTDPPGDAYLDSSLAVVGGAAYVHDTVDLWRIPLDGGTAKTIHHTEDASLVRVVAAGGRLVVWRRNPEGGDELVVMTAEGAVAATIWASQPYGAAPQLLAGGSDAVYLHAPELGAVLRIPLPD